ncbi:imidazole glycerol phosphate synthase subunit HisH [Ruania alkalisoli]|uniref:Imidazole glycerol phosphate synthase subunit HisH n=1 Tax=Ruania alkalisoli TaxID=2779775 RepID=A0A7M1SX55_9MICO|nr:imidazole glycerol phosphate synthase subunit HisH [Ruania alkalisoli]QOR72170.1 imidazole glycerol phosphate synthase subunit HisH [Ruania alkalisoli]
MTTSRVVVLDYGSGNVRSAVRALERVGAAVELTADPASVLAADGLLVPGVGAFASVMEGLRNVGAPRLIDLRLAGGRPVLGICVGLQVMFTRGQEHGDPADGLDQWAGVVERLDAPVVPHMGWSTVEPPENSALFAGIERERFYFVHSYAARSAPDFVDVTWSQHGPTRFVAAAENGPLRATQFHPEKSGDAGAELLRNWLGTL